MMVKNIPKRKLLLRGTGASRGKIKSRVVVINSIREFSKMKKGRVLVAPMTSPTWLMVMHQAAAIITDNGGMLSHAAIICREFSIPAVVGTREATKILKDGEQILVDGTNGVIYGKK